MQRIIAGSALVLCTLALAGRSKRSTREVATSRQDRPTTSLKASITSSSVTRRGHSFTAARFRTRLAPSLRIRRDTGGYDATREDAERDRRIRNETGRAAIPPVDTTTAEAT